MLIKPPLLPPSEYIVACTIWLLHAVPLVMFSAAFVVLSRNSSQDQCLVTVVVAAVCGPFALGSTLLLTGREVLLSYLVWMGLALAVLEVIAAVVLASVSQSGGLLCIALISGTLLVSASIAVWQGRWQYRRWRVRWRRWQRQFEHHD